MNRTDSREAAFIIAFEKSFLQDEPTKEIIADAEEMCDFKVGEYTYALLQAMEDHAEAIDTVIAPHLRGWAMARLDSVSRTILRLATAEMLYCATPAGVVINEAVDLAKNYGNSEEYAFVNGVLSSVLKEHKDEVTH